MNRTFIKGLELSELFYREAVKPILAKHFPDLTYSAALIGLGSEVLSFDTPQSMDHDWGPRLMLFLGETDHETYHDGINQTLRQELPGKIHGYPTSFGHHDDGTTVMTATDSGPINHGVMFLMHNPAHADQRFRWMPSTHSGPCRPPVPVAWRPLFGGHRNPWLPWSGFGGRHAPES